MPIKIKAARIPSATPELKVGWVRGVSARKISEATYRRLLALVRACEKLQGTSTNMFALYAPLAELHAQCEKENKRD